MVHLVAELLDNATAFSPPDSAVVVEARRVGDRSVLLVEDHGIGISPEQLAELNDRLANPPMVDVAVSRMMGLVVVARLAARHGVKVELRPARERGSVADVTLPSGVLVPRALAGRGAGGMPTAGMPSSSPREAIPLRPTQVPRSPAGPPLALESGPAIGRPGQRPAYADNGGGFPGGGLGGFTAPPPPSAPSVPPAPRGLPAWSDLTGVNGHDTRPARPSPGYGDPLPQRRSGDHWTLDGEVSSGEEPAGPIPRQRPFAPEGRATEAPPVVPSGPPVPPAWPPASPAPGSQPGGPPEPHGLGHTPPTERTAEMPRVRLDWEPAPPDTAGDYDGSDARQRFVDETMELPIFREVESAWFRGRGTSPAEAVPPNGGNAPAEYAYPDYASAPPMVTEPDDHYPGGGYAPRVSTDRVTAAPSASWQTAADEGWQAAAALADEQDFAVTETGLPRRVPMSQLVPGGVEKTASTAHRRTPESVRGLLSAYHRGVQRGRSQQPSAGDPKTPEPTTAGPQNPQGGKEQEA
jgi:hypothetical protein